MLFHAVTYILDNGRSPTLCKAFAFALFHNLKWQGPLLHKHWSREKQFSPPREEDAERTSLNILPHR